jgi:hypothetical protein
MHEAEQRADPPTQAAPILRAGETPLVVFISSVMDEEMSQPRKDARLALDAPFLVPWAFESTPANPDRADWTYLSKAASADALLWLVGSCTTEPVRREVQVARENNVPLFVIRLENATPDPDTEALIGDLGLSVKWVTVPAGGVREAVALSIGDEIVRAWRGKPGRERAAMLEDRGRWSRAHCIARWQAVGVARQEALIFADNLDVGRPSDEVRPTPERPLRVIRGDVGSGKTLTGHRLFQEAVAAAISDPDAPVPVWFRARNAGEDLVSSIIAACQGVGDAQRQGAFVVIDGADEIGSYAARTLLTEARVAAEALPGTRIVITSRPLPAFEGIEEVGTLPLLSLDEALSLITSITGRRTTGYGWPAAVTDAITRPLFALFLADWLRTRPGTPNTPGEMLQGLIDRAVPADQIDVNTLLRQLAWLSTDRGEAPVLAVEVGTPTQLAGLADNRLVVQHEGRLAFALPIYTQWFAAQALIQHEVEIAELVQNPVRLDLWRYALVVATRQLDFEASCNLLEPLVETEPALASQIIAEALREYEQPQQAENINLAPTEVARRIRRTSASWLRGLQPVSQLLPFSTADGSQPLAMGVSVDGSDLCVVRRPRDSAEQEDVELPSDVRLFSPNPGWGAMRMSRPVTEPAWPWRWTLHDVAAGVKPWVAQKLLPVDDGPLFEEAAWAQALLLTGKGSLTPTPIPLADIEQGLARFPPGAMVRDHRGVYDLRAIRAKLTELKAQGSTELAPPWPAADIYPGGSFVWDLYSPEQLLARTTAVYQGALNGYKQLVEHWFPKVGPRLTVFATLPATAIGTLYFDKKDHDFTGGPVLQWLLHPVEQGQSTSVTFDVKQESAGFMSDELRERHETAHDQLRALRPAQQHWISASAQGTALQIFDATPATNLAYEMLQADLKSVNISA